MVRREEEVLHRLGERQGGMYLQVLLFLLFSFCFVLFCYCFTSNNDLFLFSFLFCGGEDLGMMVVVDKVLAFQLRCHR